MGTEETKPDQDEQLSTSNTPRKSNRLSKKKKRGTESSSMNQKTPRKKINTSPNTSGELMLGNGPPPEYTEEYIAKRPHKCDMCGWRFERADYLMVHIRRHKGENPYECKYCDKSFPRSTDRNVHERYHTNQKSHFCSVCNKGFNRPYNLKVHLRVHTKDRPYKCAQCPKSYSQSNDLKTHLRKHTGERSVCDICGESFLLEHRLSHHKRMVHDIDVPSKISRLAKFEG